MSEANKSLMLSEAEIIEAINSDSLISVSLGAGQPQKNVKMSTLATVAAGLFPTVNYSDKGVATPTMYSMASRKISGNNSSRKWIKLCSVVRYEGYLSSGLIEVSGGSNYVSPPSLVYISFSNQSVGSVAKNTIHSPGTELSCSFGYNYSDDGTLNIYMYTAAYNSHIYLRVVNEYVPNTIKVSGEILSSEPSGITLLQ